MDERHSKEPVASGSEHSESRSLAAIVEELAQLSDERRGEVGVMRDAVIELSHAVARLLEMVREDRAEQRQRVDALETEIAELRQQLDRAREQGFVSESEELSGSDFDRLRIAAEELRASTERLVRENRGAAPPERSAEAEASADAGALPDDDLALDEALAAPAVLRVFPGTVGVPDTGEPVEPPATDDADTLQSGAPADERPAAEPQPQSTPEAADAAEDVPVAELGPRPARRRGMTLRRRRIDARQLRGVDPATALRALTAAVDPRWTAGRGVHLAVALTDGERLEITGGDGAPLAVAAAPDRGGLPELVASGSQLVPLFGRLTLGGDEPLPQLRGPRRDADLIAGWIDRAQRLDPEPL